MGLLRHKEEGLEIEDDMVCQLCGHRLYTEDKTCQKCSSVDSVMNGIYRRYCKYSQDRISRLFMD